MATTDTFEGAKNGFTFFFAYLNTVGQDIGMERAVALETRVCEKIGSTVGKAIKQQAGVDEIDARIAASLTGRSIEEGLGVHSELMQEGAKKSTSKIGRCPLYEAAQELGMDGATTETICRAGAIRYMDTMVKQFNPHLSYQLREFRSSAESSCIEEVMLS
jgi:hypothetical protein